MTLERPVPSFPIRNTVTEMVRRRALGVDVEGDAGAPI